MPTISVVIPVRNDAPMLAACLAALDRQTRAPEEIVVVDNGSTDDTAAVCASAGVRRVYQEVPGIAGATAAGFDAAGGQILARLDADSVPPPRWLERVEMRLASSGPLTAVTGPGDFYGAGRFTCWVARNIYIGGYIRAVGLLLGHPPLFGSNFALPAPMWAALRNRVHRDRSEVHDDLDLSYQIRPDMSVIYDPRLRVGVSARPFYSWRGLGSRILRAYQTFDIDFRAEPPGRRLRERHRLRHRRRAGRKATPPPHTAPKGHG
ncbi:glycosyltransferase family 2 protein [Arthrobacter sp. zg-Y1219]|uniref:glycosyltransferase family A protein n=1 Tax=Arthrobacter sp. zg-Y1219 TaxID=3049067 RepID=UPI0024C24E5B|nr:glycosyltransferase family 2 protein [Arthrobacter sp. zg-Y1219]MDK1358785.1 glycosyltransferase family 2 protein [Arthrobacter sp. zg-Y1219]